ncbi:GAF domain-containing protein (plasmid) [Pseudoalteromonas espejiana]
MNFLRRFHDIVSDQALNFDNKIKAYYILASKFFNLDIAIINKVETDCYTVLYAITPDNSLTPGTQFDLDGTYCVHTLGAGSACFSQRRKSSIANHPCYLNFQLESYIGAPIKVGGKFLVLLIFHHLTTHLRLATK